MNYRILFSLLTLLCFSQLTFGQNERTKVVVSPYTVNIYTITSTGGRGTLITSSASIAENTVYYVEVSTSTSSSTAASVLCRLFDGFESGLWSGGGFVPYSNPTVAQGDGTSFVFRIRTFSGWDFVTPLSMRVYECHYLTGSCANPGGAGWANQRLVAFP
jgi:hypothetical protein